MATTDTVISNMALRHLGVGQEIGDVTTETSEEANACRVFLDRSRDATIRDGRFPFATKFATLNLVSSDPTTEWAYEYTYPADCLDFKRIFSGIRNDTRQTRVPYKIVQGAASRVIYTDQKEACAEYTARITSWAQVPVDLELAISYRLAAYIAPSITKGDPFKMQEKMIKLYGMELDSAMANAFNEQQDEEHPQSEFERVRGYGNGTDENGD